MTSQNSFTAIDPRTAIGLLSLTVADLSRSVEYYRDRIGFEVLQQDAGEATLGVVGRPLLLLTERDGAREWPRGGRSYTGLYHFAILVPTRADLGRWLRHWLSLGLPLPGQGDHLVSEALYLEDPDGNGIEIYRDRPRDQWTWSGGQIRMAVDPVDISGVLAEGDAVGESWSGLVAGTRIGHMHLQVGAIDRARAFYHDVLGFEIVAEMPSALFVSAGGYHHHLGLNTWHSLNAGSAPEDFAGLRFFTLELADEAARQAVLDRVTRSGAAPLTVGNTVAVRDPWNNVLILGIGETASSEAAADLRSAAGSLRAGAIG